MLFILNIWYIKLQSILTHTLHFEKGNKRRENWERERESENRRKSRKQREEKLEAGRQRGIEERESKHTKKTHRKRPIQIQSIDF